MQSATNAADVSPAENDDDPEYLEKRREFLNRFFGTEPGGVAPRAYAAALDAARALPASPLLQGGRFMSPETLQVTPAWTSPISPPMQNSYGGNASATIFSLAIDPVNANVVYTGSFGGLAKTTDGGVTWRYLSDGWATQSVSAIAVNPGASNDVYVGTGREGSGYGSYEVGLYHSFDGGATWSSPLGKDQFKGTFIRTIAIDPSASTVYLANGGADNCGLWRSTDSGVTWTQLYQVDNGIYDVAIDAATHPSTLYITEDNGTFKSTDSGTTWTLIHSVLENSRNRLSVVNSTLYLLGPGDPDHNLYKSVDGGATWIQIATRCFAGADSCDDANGSIGFWVFAVDPLNPRIILGGNQALYRTDDEGMTWTEIGDMWGNDPDPALRIHTDQRVIAFSATAHALAYEGNDGGAVRSTDYGKSWTNLNQNLPGALMYSVALSADGSMMAGTQDNGAVLSKAGAPWEVVSKGDSNHDLIDPVGRTWAYSVINNQHSFTRHNRQTEPPDWENISPAQFIVRENPRTYEPCAFFPTFSMNPSGPTHLIAACQHVVRTLDGTASPVVWTTIGGPLGDASGNYVTAAYQAPSNSNVIYAVRGWDTVFVTSNADQGNGAVWNQVTQQHHPDGIHAVMVDPLNYQIAYLASDSGVYKTTDMGMTWTQHGISNLIYNDVAIDPVNPQHIFAASNAGVFASTDGGSTWGNMSEGIPTGMKVTALSFNAMSRQLAASTYGRGAYMLHLGLPQRPSPTPRPRPTPRPMP
jgi:photosystem II stability/assembly factor-like uncharacterized protein